ALYHDDDAGSRIAEAHGDGSTAAKTSTGLSYSVTAGKQYRYCYCGDGSAAAFTVIGYPGNLSANRTLAALLNAVSTHAGTAAHSCDASTAVPPSTTGALSANTSVYPVIFEIE